MDKDIIFTHERVLDCIVIEGKFRYSPYITIGLDSLSDFFIKLEFINMSVEDMKQLNLLFNEPKALSFSSDIVHKAEYNITHIVITKFNSIGNDVTLECLSDDPNLSLIIE